MKITMWIREIIGWTLLVAGLFTFRSCFDFLHNGQVVEAGIGSAIGFAIFRGGLGFVRLSMASRALVAD